MIKKLVMFFGLALTVIYMANRQDYNRYWLRLKLSESVVMLTNVEGNSGGTGFTVEAASGKKYILTNDHVCELGRKTGIVYANESGFIIPLKIMYRSIYTDLCLVSPLEYKPALKLASSYEWGQQIVVVGHPLLYDTTMTEGELVQERRLQVIAYEVTEDRPCENYPKFKQAKVNYFFFQIDACILDVDAIWTTAQILPGNSGSVVADLNGDVVGVAFAAGPQELNRGWMIPLGDIYQFLKGY